MAPRPEPLALLPAKAPDEPLPVFDSWEGAPFHDYETQLQFMRGNLKRRKDNFAVAHGPEGVGKSTILMNIAMDLDPHFEPIERVIFTVEDLLLAIINGKEGGVLLVDEGANLFYNRDWNTVEQKELTRIQRQARILRSQWLIAMPDYEALDPYLRNHRTFTRFYCPPYFDAEGMTPGPAKVLWRKERFDYEAQAVTHRWTDVYDLEVPSIDEHPMWRGYESLKRRKVVNQAQALLDRLRAGPKKAGRPKKSKGKSGVGETEPKTPPTT